MVVPSSRILIVHPSRFNPENPPAGTLAIRSRDQLGADFRAMDDLSPSTSVGDFRANVIAQLGYKHQKSGQAGKMPIPRGSIVIPCRAPDGRITALHDDKGRWFTTPQPHVVNMVRANFTRQIHVFNFTVEADVWALQHNDACVALNNFRIEMLSQYLTGPNPRIVRYLEAVAA